MGHRQNTITTNMQVFGLWDKEGEPGETPVDIVRTWRTQRGPSTDPRPSLSGVSANQRYQAICWVIRPIHAFNVQNKSYFIKIGMYGVHWDKSERKIFIEDVIKMENIGCIDGCMIIMVNSGGGVSVFFLPKLHIWRECSAAMHTSQLTWIMKTIRAVCKWAHDRPPWVLSEDIKVKWSISDRPPSCL